MTMTPTTIKFILLSISLLQASLVRPFQNNAIHKIPRTSSHRHSTQETNRTVTILSRGPNHIIALKPPSVVCHHSGWTGSRSKAKRGEEPEIPMLQRVRDAVHSIDSKRGDERAMRRVNLVHRLDRGASGALLLAFADEDTEENENEAKGATATLISAMESPQSQKTYVALVRGEGILRGEDLTKKGWFEISRPIKDERGEEKDATTLVNFVAGQPEFVDEDGVERPRISLVLAKPKSGRWHQIRKHLNGLSHPILGDSTHGSSKVNREWKEKRNMPGERLCLHMARLQLPLTPAVPEGIDTACPLPNDMLDMLRVHAPQVLHRALPVLEKEGILLLPEKEYEVGEYTITQVLFPKEKVDILAQEEHYVVVHKPPGVVAHHSAWTGKRSDPRRWKEPMPMLQRVRDATGRTVNLVHRLDRGASGCMLFAFTRNPHETDKKQSCTVTRTLIQSMQSPRATKTYIALCDGDGTWKGENLLHKGWIHVDLPVKDENGKIIQGAKTDIRFLASRTLSHIDDEEGRRVTLVLARPSTGKWHQIRQHLASGTIGHAVLGDSSHGRSRTNRVWKKRSMMRERTCLHLARIQLPPTEFSPNGVDVRCPLSEDLMGMLEGMPGLLDEARPLLLDEGVEI